MILVNSVAIKRLKSDKETKMKRAIKFKLKNGKVVAIRRVRDTDYEAVMTYFETFSAGPSAKWTSGYPRRDNGKGRDHVVKPWGDPNKLFVIAVDGDRVVGMASVHKQKADLYSGRSAVTGTAMLEEYTSNGLGNKFKQITEKWARENEVHKLEASVRHKNVRSLGNLLKNGYEVVGIMHDCFFIDGEWHHKYLLEKILEK